MWPVGSGCWGSWEWNRPNPFLVKSNVPLRYAFRVYVIITDVPTMFRGHARQWIVFGFKA